MRVTLRLLAGGLAIACMISLGSFAKADLFTVAGSPPAPSTSDLTIDVDLSTVGNTLASLGPLAITDDPGGGATATVTAPVTGAAWSAGTGNGDLTFTGGELDVEDVPPRSLTWDFWAPSRSR